MYRPEHHCKDLGVESEFVVTSRDRRDAESEAMRVSVFGHKPVERRGKYHFVQVFRSLNRRSMSYT